MQVVPWCACLRCYKPGRLFPYIPGCRAAGKHIHAWTANTAEMMARVLEAGVDAVVTNHPRLLLAALDSRARVCARRRRLGAR